MDIKNVANDTVALWVKNYLNLYEGNDVIDKFINDFKSSEINEDNYKSLIDEWAKENDIKFRSGMDFIKPFITYVGNIVVPEGQRKFVFDNLSNMNEEATDFFKELLQNADDCKYDKRRAEFTAELSDESLYIHYNENGMTPENIIALAAIAESDKAKRKLDDESLAPIGEKGIGFKTVFESVDYVDIVSGDFCFRYGVDRENAKFYVSSIEPKSEKGTSMRFYFAEKIDGKKMFEELSQKYEAKNQNDLLCNCPVLFTKNLRSIKISYGEEYFSVETDKEKDKPDFKITAKSSTLEKPLTISCFSVYEDVELGYNEISEYLGDNTIPADTTIKRRIEIVGSEDVTEGNIYIYLPTHTKISAPFSVQLPVKANQNRSGVYFEDGATIKWNKKLLQAFIPLTIKFYDKLQEKNYELYRYVPDFETEKILFQGKDSDKLNAFFRGTELISELINYPYFKTLDGGYCNVKEAIALDDLFNENPKVANSWLSLIKYSNRKPIVVNDEILKYSKRIGLKKFGYEKYNYTDLFNKLIEEFSMQKTVPEKLDGTKIKEKLTKANLKIYPAITTNGIRYLSLNNDEYWFKSNNLKSRENSFIHFISEEDYEYINKHIILNENNPFRSIPLYESEVQVLERLEPKYHSLTLSEGRFIQLCEYVYDNTPADKRLHNDPVVHCRKLLEECPEETKENSRETKYNAVFLLSKIAGNTELNIYSKGVHVLLFRSLYVKKSKISYGFDFSSDCLHRNDENWIRLFEILNSIPFELNPAQLNPNNLTPLPVEDKNYKDIGINNFYIFNELPTKFLRLKNKIILKEEEYLNESLEGILVGSMKSGIIVDFFENSEDCLKPAVYSDKLKDLSALAYYHIINSRTTPGEPNNNPAYELLQNADDCKRRNRIDGIGKDFKISYNGEKEVILKYSEAGFTLKDFYCITGRGKSSNENYAMNTGRFGTGFASIYKICEKVEIYSNDIKCELRSGIIPRAEDVLGEKDEITQNLNFYNYYENDDKKQISKYCPVPVFSKYDNPDKHITEIRLTFIDKKDVWGFLEDLTAPENYVFLKDIKYPPETNGFDLSERKIFPEGTNENLKFYKFGESENQKPLCEIYFPPVSDSSYPLYCNLPLSKENALLPFMLNIPSVRPSDDRTNIANDNENKNVEILKKVLSVGLKECFEAYAKDGTDVYKYLPYESQNLYTKAGQSKEQWANYLNTFKVIRCSDGKLYSKEEILDGVVKVFTSVFYKLLENASNTPSVVYLDEKTASVLGIKSNYSTIIDTIIKNNLKVDKIFDACLPHIRTRLYTKDEKTNSNSFAALDVFGGSSANNVVGTDDALLKIISKNKLVLSCFNDEKEAWEGGFFEKGLVAFRTPKGCMVYNPEYRYYFLEITKNEEKEKLNASDFGGRIITSPSKVVEKCGIINLSDAFNEDNIDDFLKSESESLIEFAIEKFHIDNNNKLSEIFTKLLTLSDKKYLNIIDNLIGKYDAPDDFLSIFIGIRDINNNRDYVLKKIKKLLTEIKNPDEKVSEFIDFFKAEPCAEYLSLLKTVIAKATTISRESIKAFCDILSRNPEIDNTDDIYEVVNQLTEKGEIDNDFVDFLAEKACNSERGCELLVKAINRYKNSYLVLYSDILKSEHLNDDIIKSPKLKFFFRNEDEKERIGEVDYPRLYKLTEKIRSSGNFNYNLFSGDKGTQYIYFLKISKDISGSVSDNKNNTVILYNNDDNIESALIDFLKGNGFQLEACKEFEAIESLPVIKELGFRGDMLEKIPEELIDEACEDAEKLNKAEKDILKKHLMGTYQVHVNGNWYDFSGYGKDKPVICPVCDGKILSQSSSLDIRYAYKGENARVPLLMCRNCCETFDKHIMPASITCSDGYELFTKDAKITLTLEFASGDKFEKELDMPFLHKMMLYFNLNKR